MIRTGSPERNCSQRVSPRSGWRSRETGVSTDDTDPVAREPGVMTTTTASSASIRAVGGRYLVRSVVHLAELLAFDAAALLAGVRLTGLGLSELCLLVLPPMMAGSGAVLTFLALNGMLLRSEAAEAADERTPDLVSGTR
ncbi:hypothetical protein A5713_16075 [Mycobacterium sp. E2497]|nr:hypothetical protein A5713_16075 [Mycobacterium sp. E2497]